MEQWPLRSQEYWLAVLGVAEGVAAAVPVAVQIAAEVVEPDTAVDKVAELQGMDCHHREQQAPGLGRQQQAVH